MSTRKNKDFNISLNNGNRSYGWGTDTVNTDVVNAAESISEKYTELIQAIKRVQRINTISTILIIAGIFTPAMPPLALALVAGLIIKIFTHTKMPIRMNYTLDESSQSAFDALTEMWLKLSKSKKFWQINTETSGQDKKTHGGASTTVTRTDAVTTRKCPYYLKTNVKPFGLSVNGKRVFFLPDRLLMIDKKRVGLLSYDDVQIRMGKTRFVESDAVPKDAKVIGETWLKVNKDGSPDKRFKGNRKVPVCEYGEVYITYGDTLNIAVMCSNSSLIDDMRVQLAQVLSQHL